MTDSSRRDFLKTSSAAAIGAGIAGSLANGAYAAADDTLKIALVGCGGRGTGAASQALKTTGNVKLIAMADAFSDQLDASLGRIKKQVEGNDTATVDVADDHKFTGFDAYKQILETDADLVIFATPPGFRPIHFEAAIAAGKHVFMEKPVAVDPLGVRQVLAAARKASEKNLKVGVGLQRHHKASYIDMVQRIKDGAIGDLVAMHVYWNNRGVWEPRKSREEVATEMEYQMRNWYYYNWLCGDHIVEQHIHNLDVGCWLMGEYPVSARGMGGRGVRTDKRYGEIYDHHSVEYTFKNGEKMFSYCRHQPNTWSLVEEFAHGTKGRAHLTNANKMTYQTYGSDGDDYSYRNARKDADPYQVEHETLQAAIRADEAYNEAEYGALSTMTAIYGRMVTYSGKEISWDDALNSKVSIRPEKYAWDAMPPTVPNENGEYPIPVPGLTKVL